MTPIHESANTRALWSRYDVVQNEEWRSNLHLRPKERSSYYHDSAKYRSQVLCCSDDSDITVMIQVRTLELCARNASLEWNLSELPVESGS
jgi:hypothetical protein